MGSPRPTRNPDQSDLLPETFYTAKTHIVAELNTRLITYARDMKPAEWIKAQPAFLGAQGKTLFDPDFDIDDGGLPHEKAVLPR